MNGAIPPLPLHVFMAFVGKVLPFYHYQRWSASSSVWEISNTYQEKFSVSVLRRLYGRLLEVICSVGKTKAKRGRLAPRFGDSWTCIKIWIPYRRNFDWGIYFTNQIISKQCVDNWLHAYSLPHTPIHLCLQLTYELTDGTLEQFILNEYHPFSRRVREFAKSDY